MAKITAQVSYSKFKVYINDILHIMFLTKNYNGVQSWFEGDQTRTYFIEIYLKVGEPILLEYDAWENWTNILKLIDEKV